jgi:hypothetical protein
MRDETRDLLTRILPFLSPAASEVVTTYLMTEEYPKKDRIEYLDTKFYDGFVSPYEWDKIYWTMRSEMYNLGGYRSLKQIVKFYEQRNQP